jgi:hypothetical protein
MDIPTSGDYVDVKKYLVGIKAWSWIALALTAIILILSSLTLTTNLHSMSILPPSDDVIYLPLVIPGSIFGISVSAIVIALYITTIIGIYNKKAFSVKLVRALLILTMLSIPIGTIIGGVLLRRINNPLVKKYFNYIK